MEEINNCFDNLVKALETERTKLKREKEELENKKKDWNQFANKLDKTQLSERIKLDVGGKIFATTLTTLVACQGSYFEAMFSGRWDLKKQEDGSFFIDRDPFVFRFVMNFLRGEPFQVELLTEEKKHKLLEDAEFYHLDKLVDLLKPIKPVELLTSTKPVLKWKQGPNYTVSGNDIVKTGSNSICDATALLDVPFSSDLCEVSVKLKKTYNSNIVIGVAPTSLNQSQVDNYTQCGWYIHAYSGSLYSQSGDCRNKQDVWKNIGKTGEGGIVIVRVDLKKGEISFVVNGSDCGVAFRSIPTTTPLCLAVCLAHDGDVVELVAQ
eukprot:TRINITY_DN2473_c0_g1_i3.p1 TRINITY_DN2473_c0_g1~~TRINITY_DN2473_c0_g1_i3.p1  ORF type:complete len:322 (-),score=72.98 TRINITY_DN2473_c0_g1_i3:71-1036(-)